MPTPQQMLLKFSSPTTLYVKRRGNIPRLQVLLSSLFFTANSTLVVKLILSTCSHPHKASSSVSWFISVTSQSLLASTEPPTELCLKRTLKLNWHLLVSHLKFLKGFNLKMTFCHFIRHHSLPSLNPHLLTTMSHLQPPMKHCHLHLLPAFYKLPGSLNAASWHTSSIEFYTLDKQLQDITNQWKRACEFQLSQTERIVKCSCIDLKAGETGDNVPVPIPMVDRDRGNPRNILGVNVDWDEHIMYRNAVKAGILSTKYSRNQFLVWLQQRQETVSDKQVQVL